MLLLSRSQVQKTLSLSLYIYIYIYILGAKCKYPPTAYKVYIILSIYIYKEERTENRRCKMQIPTNHAYKVYIYNSLEEPFQFIYFT